jgi:hypothetical protein
LKTLVRAAVVVPGAAGLCFAFALAAHADVGNPTSAYQSAFKIAQMQQPAPVVAKPAPAATKPDPTNAQAPAGRGEPVATPVPEQFVSEAPAPVVMRRQSSEHGSAVARIVFGAEAKYREIEAFFGRVASAPQGGPGGGAGVPVLVLAFLSVAAALNRHRLLGNRWATDENVFELLYARELTPPG